MRLNDKEIFDLVLGCEEHLEVEVWRGSNKGPRENNYMKYK